MYTGHVAIALGARGLRRDLPLWLLVLATQACDWVEVIVRSVPPRLPADVYSHAFPFVFVAALAAAAVVWLWKRSIGAALTVLIVYLSHPAADYFTGYKPMWLGGPRMGLQISQEPATDFLCQALLCLVGVALYWRSLSPSRARRTLAAVPLALLLALQGLSDVVLARRGQREPTTRVVSVPASTLP